MSNGMFLKPSYVLHQVLLLWLQYRKWYYLFILYFHGTWTVADTDVSVRRTLQQKSRVFAIN